MRSFVISAATAFAALATPAHAALEKLGDHGVVTRHTAVVAVEPMANDALSEPGAAEMVDEILPIYLRGKLYRAILETKASEDAIRRQAMKSATDNAEDLLKGLTRSYNKARQQAITSEMQELAAGAGLLGTQ